jgi:multiple RNA-binding domain-containing protein 1
MSRLIVKNLPKRVTEAKLREAFSARGGDITDVQLKYTKDGVFRHFGFVGFHSEEDARLAQKYLDGTYIGASKVSVQICADLGSVEKPRAWSKYSVDSSRSIVKPKEDEVLL